jgi:hypothetical protein
MTLDQNTIIRTLTAAYPGVQVTVHEYNEVEVAQRAAKGWKAVRVDNQVVEWLDDKVAVPTAEEIREHYARFRSEFDKQDADAGRLAGLTRRWPMEQIIESFKTKEGREAFIEEIESFIAGE